jgi:phosphatidylglycerol---prolipoprotein diacylglyceryl transferase
MPKWLLPNLVNHLLMFSYIVWNVDPEIFSATIFGTEIALRWYGVLFAACFAIGHQLLLHIYKREGKTERDVDALTVYVAVGLIVGARLGHFLFYEWETLIATPGIWLLELVIPPFSGLASHGATIGILLAIYFYSRSRKDQPFFWVADRISILAAVGATFIRIGNLMNSEIYGDRTSLPWGFIFERETDPNLLPLVPRHPTQLYEAIFAVLLFFITFSLWKKKRSEIPNGTITAVFLIVLFSSRFLIEFLKNSQKDFENTLFLNMGQLLSIPAIIVGIIILIIGNRTKRKNASVQSVP